MFKTTMSDHLPFEISSSGRCNRLIACIGNTSGSRLAFFKEHAQDGRGVEQPPKGLQSISVPLAARNRALYAFKKHDFSPDVVNNLRIAFIAPLRSRLSQRLSSRRRIVFPSRWSRPSGRGASTEHAQDGRGGVSRALCASIILTLMLCAACGHKKQNMARVPAAPVPSPAPRDSAAPGDRPAPRTVPPPAPLPPGYSEEGIASWYGIPYHGRRAADGEIYDMETLVAAHRLMPFNTWLRVTNLSNGKTVTVRIIDRGPFIDGRIIDLSKAAARQIDLIGPGTGRVRLEVISAPQDVPSNDFFAVQVGSFTVYANAEEARARYAEKYGNAHLELRSGPVPRWRVLVGKFPTVESARELSNVLSGENPDIFIVRLDQTPVPAVTPTLTPSAAVQTTPIP